MPRPADPAKRQEILHRVVQHISAVGLQGQSLKTIGDAINTSPRMLVHYFGSATQLRIEALSTIREVFRANMNSVPDSALASPKYFLLACAAQLEDSAHMHYMTIFFELFGMALKNPSDYGNFAQQSVEPYLTDFRQIAATWNVPESRQADIATILLALGRGLTADLVATKDVTRVHSAVVWVADLFEQEIAGIQR